MATANQSPGSILNFNVEFTTTDLSNGNLFSEPHTVSGPTGSFTNPLNAVTITGNKVVVPLTSNTSQGSYYLKFHLPQPSASKFYVTFAQKNSNLSDGYYDYTTGIPSDYRTALKTFVNDGSLSVPSTSTVKNKNLKFTVYGLDSNQVSQAIQYTVKFSAIFGTGGGGVNG